MVNVVLPDNKDRSLAFFLAMEEFVASWMEVYLHMGYSRSVWICGSV